MYEDSLTTGVFTLS